MTKYKKYVAMMIDDNRSVFAEFRKLHDAYALDQEGLQDKFNEEGDKIMDLVREYENRLCRNTERGMYIRYSSNLAEKFQSEVRKVFPMIDHVGLIVEKPIISNGEGFAIKKIELR